MKRHFCTKTPNIYFLPQLENRIKENNNFTRIVTQDEKMTGNILELSNDLYKREEKDYNHYSICFTIREGWGTEDGEEAGFQRGAQK